MNVISVCVLCVMLLFVSSVCIVCLYNECVCVCTCVCVVGLCASMFMSVCMRLCAV